MSNFRTEEEPVTAVGRFHLRELTRQQESIVNVDLEIQKAHRGGLNPNRGLVELGAFRTKRLRRLPQIEILKQNSKSDTIRAESEPAKPKRDRMHLARQHQALMNSGEFESQAALARFLSVSRARVTQVLNRLVEPDSDTQSKIA